MNTYTFVTDLLHLDIQWLKEETNIRETIAVEALLRGIRADLDFIINRFHLEKIAFLEIVNLIQCFGKNITLSKLLIQEWG